MFIYLHKIILTHLFIMSTLCICINVFRFVTRLHCVYYVSIKTKEDIKNKQQLKGVRLQFYYLASMKNNNQAIELSNYTQKEIKMYKIIQKNVENLVIEHFYFRVDPIYRDEQLKKIYTEHKLLVSDLIQVSMDEMLRYCDRNTVYVKESNV